MQKTEFDIICERILATLHGRPRQWSTPDGIDEVAASIIVDELNKPENLRVCATDISDTTDPQWVEMMDSVYSALDTQKVNQTVKGKVVEVPVFDAYPILKSAEDKIRSFRWSFDSSSVVDPEFEQQDKMNQMYNPQTQAWPTRRLENLVRPGTLGTNAPKRST